MKEAIIHPKDVGVKGLWENQETGIFIKKNEKHGRNLVRVSYIKTNAKKIQWCTDAQLLMLKGLWWENQKSGFSHQN